MVSSQNEHEREITISATHLVRTYSTHITTVTINRNISKAFKYHCRMADIHFLAISYEEKTALCINHMPELTDETCTSFSLYVIVLSKHRSTNLNHAFCVVCRQNFHCCLKRLVNENCTTEMVLSSFCRHCELTIRVISTKTFIFVKQYADLHKSARGLWKHRADVSRTMKNSFSAILQYSFLPPQMEVCIGP